jgi:hypothetical protein
MVRGIPSGEKRKRRRNLEKEMTERICEVKAVLEMGRYAIPELLFVPEFHTGTY